MSGLSRDDLYWSRPADPTGSGVLVLAGSSGRLDTGRAEVLAGSGATALALRWFGGVGQPALPREVALETFVEALDLLAVECDRIGVLGLSYGAEAALLTGVRDRRIGAVVALSPTDVVWEGHREHDHDPPASKWTWRGEPVPFVPLDQTWTSDSPQPAFTRWYERSRATADPATIAAATIPVERIHAELLLVVGGDDQVWPSGAAADAIRARRATHGLATTVVADPDAGHHLALPGEPTVSATRPYLVGGHDRAAHRLGRLAWPAIKSAFGLR